MAKGSKNKKLKRQLHKISNNDWVQDYCEQIDEQNFVKSCMGPTTLWNEVKDMDTLEIRFFCREHDLHSYEDVLMFAMEHTNWTMQAFIGVDSNE